MQSQFIDNFYLLLNHRFLPCRLLRTDCSISTHVRHGSLSGFLGRTNTDTIIDTRRTILPACQGHLNNVECVMAIGYRTQ